MQSNSIKYSASCCSIKGDRDKNQDAGNFSIDNNGNLLGIICDGIGSHENSEIVSNKIVEFITNSFLKNKKNNSIPFLFYKKNLIKAQKTINKAIKNSNNKRKEIGSTLVSFIIIDNMVSVCNLGDSRLYHYNSKFDQWMQITKDQILVNQINDEYDKKEEKLIKDGADQTKIDLNFINREVVINENYDSLFALTHCMESFTHEYKNCDTYQFEVNQNDILFACSDGVYKVYEKMLSLFPSYKTEVDLSFINKLIEKAKNFSDISKLIVEKALKDGSDDNITSLVVRIN